MIEKVKKKTTGGEPVQIEVVGKEGPVEVQVIDNNDGTYTVAYMGAPGEYKVTAKLYGKHIKGSPFQYLVNFELKSL